LNLSRFASTCLPSVILVKMRACERAHNHPGSNLSLLAAREAARPPSIPAIRPPQITPTCHRNGRTSDRRSLRLRVRWRFA